MKPTFSSAPFLYIAFHKPYGVLSQFTPEDGARSLAEFGLPPDIYPAGRLDKDSEGLLLLTNDGPLISRLLEPKHDKQKIYWVQVERIPNDESLAKLKAGVKIQDYQTLPCEAELIQAPDLPPREPPIRVRQTVPDCWIEVKLKEGKNRQVRRMTAAIGHPTLRLIRIGIGKLRLGELNHGQWKEVTREDLI